MSINPKNYQCTQSGKNKGIKVIIFVQTFFDTDCKIFALNQRIMMINLNFHIMPIIDGREEVIKH